MNMNPYCEQQSHQALTQEYCIIQRKSLGKNNYGQVFRGYNHKQNLYIAIRKIDVQMYNFDEDPQIVTQFVHQNFVTNYKLFKRNKFFYLPMQLSGKSLKQIMKTDPSYINEEKVYIIMQKIIVGMTQAYKKGFIHFGIKLQNIMQNQKFNFQIGDFGLLTKDSKQQKIFQSCELYQPPEIKKTLADRSRQNLTFIDVWATGIVLFHCLNNDYQQKKLFNNSFLTHSSKMLEQFWNRIKMGFQLPLKQFHPIFDYIIHWMLQYKPQNRPNFENLLPIVNNPDIKKSVQRKSKDPNYKITDDLTQLEKQIAFHIYFQYDKYNLILTLIKQLKQCQTVLFLPIQLINLLQFFLKVMFKCLTKQFVFNKLKVYQFRLPNQKKKTEIIYLKTASDSYTLEYFSENSATQGSLLRIQIQRFSKKMERNYQMINQYLQRLTRCILNNIQNKKFGISFTEQVTKVEQYVKFPTYKYDEYRKCFKKLLNNEFLQNILKIKLLNKKILFLFRLMFIVAQLDSYFPIHKYRQLNVSKIMEQYRDQSLENSQCHLLKLNQSYHKQMQ